MSGCFASHSSLALADEKWEKTQLPGLKHPLLCHPGDPTRCAMQLEYGERAPISGVLVTQRQGAILTIRAEEGDKRVQEAAEFERRQAKNDIALIQAKWDSDKQRHADEVSAMEKNHADQVKLLEDALPSWYETPPFVILWTTLAVVGVTVGMAYLVDAVTD